jgi:hypothetical protein
MCHPSHQSTKKTTTSGEEGGKRAFIVEPRLLLGILGQVVELGVLASWVLYYYNTPPPPCFLSQGLGF